MIPFFKVFLTGREEFLFLRGNTGLILERIVVILDEFKLSCRSSYSIKLAMQTLDVGHRFSIAYWRVGTSDIYI